MPKSYSITEAKLQLSDLIHQAEYGAPVKLTRQGRPVAMVISMQEYERLHGETMDSWDAIERLRASWRNLQDEDIDPDQIFAIEKDASPGRDFSW